MVLTVTVMVEGAAAGLSEALSQLPPEVVLGVAVRVNPLGAVVILQVSAAGAVPPMVNAKLSDDGVQTAVMVGCGLTVKATGTFSVTAPGALTAIEPL